LIEEELRRAVVEDPDDDAPRLVYADWLLERGDPRGEWIRLQCAGLQTPGWQELAGELATWVTERGVRRGFVESLTMPLGHLVERFAGLLRRHPIRELDVRDAALIDEHLRALAAMPLGRIRSLVVGRTPEMARPVGLALAPLAGASFGDLRQLRFEYVGLSARDWEHLFGELDAPLLEEVHLYAIRSSASLYRALATNPRLARLRRLVEYRHDSLDRDDGELAAAFALLAMCPTFERLSLVTHGVGDDAIIPFFADDARARLRTLSIVESRLSDALAVAMARSPNLARLEELELNACSWGAGGVRTLLASPYLTSLRRLAITPGGGWTRRSGREVVSMLLALPETHPLKQVRWPTTPDTTADAKLKAQLVRRFVPW
jgi:uncharacterized protein (TIGR02996 family)